MEGIAEGRVKGAPMKGAWTEIEIAGHAADVYEPPGASQPRFGIIFLHGLGGETLRDRPAYTRVFDELGLVCICPHGRRCWWTDHICSEFDPQITPEKHVLTHVLPFMQDRWGLQPPKIGLLGNSMGGQGALRLAFKHARQFPVVATVAAAVDCHEYYGQGTPLDDMYDSKEQCRQDTATMHIHPSEYPPHIFFCIDPTDQQWFRGNDRLHEKMAALGVPHEYDLTTRAGGHSWEYANFMAERVVRFVHQGLVNQSRKLL